MSNPEPIRVTPGPDNYYSYPGALEKLGDFFSVQEQKKAFWVHGERAGAALEKFYPLPTRRRVVHRGHCTASDVEAYRRKAGKGTSVVVGAGGGTVIDTAKALASRLGVPLVAIPTLASTCAAWTPLSVWYDLQGRALGFEVFPRANFLTLTDPRIILQAPAEYLLAGIADTLVKWYEARELCAGREDLPLAARLGLETSRQVRDVLLDQAPGALESHRRGHLSPEFTQVVDGVIAGGGLVGGLGERFTRVAAAHAVHNGLTVLAQTHGVPHGLKVAYGLLIQLKLTGQTEELKTLVPFYRRLGLPLTLKDLGGDAKDGQALHRVAAKTLAPGESIHLMVQKTDEDQLVRLIQEWEEEANDA